MQSPTVIVALSKYARRSQQFDKHGRELCITMPLDAALRNAWATDAHVAQHGLSRTFPCLEKKQAVERCEAPLSLVCLLADYDLDHDSQLSPEALEQRSVSALGKLPPGWTGYRTGGGFRALSLLAQPYVVNSPESWEAWTAFYKGTILALDAIIGEVGDQKCGNPDRCFRLPNVQREGGKAAYPELYGELGVNGLLPVPVPVKEPQQPLEGFDWLSALQSGDSDAALIAPVCALNKLGTGDTACAFVAGELAAAGVSDERAERMLAMLTHSHGYARDAERDLRRAREGLFRSSAARWAGRVDKDDRQHVLNVLRTFSSDLATTVDPPPADLLALRAGVESDDMVRAEDGSNTLRVVHIGSEESIGAELMAEGEWVSDFGQLYRAEGGVWSEVSDATVYTLLRPYDGAPRMRTKQNAKTGLWEYRQEGNVILSAKFAAGVRNSMMRARERRSFFDSAPVGVAFRNGFVGTDGKLVELTGEHRQRAVLPYDYIPDAALELDAPRLRGLLNDWFGIDDDDQDAEAKAALVCEFAGLAMVGGFGPRFQTAVILYGEGHNGKSVVIELIRRLVPAMYRSALPPQLMGDQQSLAGLAGKRVNICAEIPENEVVESGNLKQILACDADVEAKVVYQPKFLFRPMAGHMFSANNLPGFRDHTKGFLRRWLFVRFTREISKEKRRPLDELVDELLREEGAGVASYLVKCGLEAYRRGLLTVPELSTAEAKEEWRSEADPVYDFVLACLESCIDSPLGQRQWPSIAELYEAYKLWCKEVGHSFTLTQKRFAKRLRGATGHESVKAAGLHRFPMKLRFKLEGTSNEFMPHKLPRDWARTHDEDEPGMVIPIDDPAMRAKIQERFRAGGF